MYEDCLHRLHAFMSFTATLCVVTPIVLMGELPTNPLLVILLIAFAFFIHFLLVGAFDLFHEFLTLFIGDHYIIKQFILGLILYFLLFLVFSNLGIINY